MSDRPRRMAREEKTVAAMIHIYCHDHHGTTDNLCTECAALAEYARLRLEECPYQDDKPTCANCPIHCYRLEMRDRIRTVMRYAGPRMLLRHPVLAVLHLFDGFKKAPSGVSARTR